jgi:hypothetical protein
VDCLPIPRIFNLLFLPIKLCLPRVPYRPCPSHSPLAWLQLDSDGFLGMSAQVSHICNIDPCPAFLCLCLLAPLPLLLALRLASLTEAKVSTGQASGKCQHVIAAVNHQSTQAFCTIMLCALHVNRVSMPYMHTVLDIKP